MLTSPPYPGVYDYLSFARKVRAGSGNATVVARPCSVNLRAPNLRPPTRKTALPARRVFRAAVGGPRVARGVDAGRDRRAQDAAKRPARVQAVWQAEQKHGDRGGVVSEAADARR